MATRTVSIDRWPKKLRLPCSHSRLAAARLSFASAARSFHATGFRELGQRHPATPPPRGDPACIALGRVLLAHGARLALEQEARVGARLALEQEARVDERLARYIAYC